MAMGILHARLYRMTSNELYRTQSLRTADAVSNRLVSLAGIYVNDRDAWTQGTFAGDWAREVLTLPGISAKHWTVLRTTADCIYTYARTIGGYYGGSWSGPADGSGSRWWAVGSKPEQIMTSSSTANMIIAAAFFETFNILRPTLQISKPLDSRTIQVTLFGEPGWSYDLQSSTNLINWTTITNQLVDQFANPFTLNAPVFGLQSTYRAVLQLQP